MNLKCTNAIELRKYDKRRAINSNYLDYVPIENEELQWPNNKNHYATLFYS